MMVIRPISSGDLNELLTMAKNAGVGFTSLPANRDLLREKIQRSEAAFSVERDPSHNQSYLFVAEDLNTGQIAGVCGIESALGLDEPWYNYRMGTLVHASPQLNVYGRSNTLSLSNDHTGCSELCTLFLGADYRHSKNGSLLSKSRFLFLANFPERFDRRIIAEMRGVSDAQGHSPFWEGLGRHFFAMDFSEADYLSGLGNKSFIAELMPKLPIYTDLLSEEARKVIGQVHQNTVPALKMLEKEGLSNQGYVDIFDGGPTIEAEVAKIRAVKDSRTFVARNKTTASEEDDTLYLIANTRLAEFRCVLGTIALPANGDVQLSSQIMAGLQLSDGDEVRLVALSTSREGEVR